ncbi:MAG: DUF389 domain-containing protein [Thiohalomonadaceae bacterium]
MTRVVQITAPAPKVDEILAHVRGMEGVLEVQAQRGGSLQPRGDVLSLVVTNQAVFPLMSMLDRLGVTDSTDMAVVITELRALVSVAARGAVAEEHSEAMWEEMEAELAKGSNMAGNALVVMLVSGLLAGIGLGTGALHLVFAAMLIAPGFEPFMRIALGLVARSRSGWRGLRAAAKGYIAVFIGAGLSTLLLKILAIGPFSGAEAYLPVRGLVNYWTSISATALVVAALGAVAGTLLVAANRAVLTGGVMVALSLIPSITIAGMALAAGDWDLLLDGLWRWALEVLMVTAFSVATLWWKRVNIQRRDMHA